MRVAGVLFAGLVCCVPHAAHALDVTFTGLVVDTCTIALATPGVMVLSTDGTELATNLGGLSVPATVTVLSIGANTITLDPPTLESHPPAYTPGGETLEIATSGLASNPVFTALGLDFVIGLLPLTNLFVDLKITNPDGFEQGIYSARSVLTCS